MNAMAADHFDIDSLAKYLHLTPQQVAKMADRDRLPGRKVGGQWRFTEAEIHHWLEERIGISDESELIEVEEVLERNVDAPEAISIADLLPPGGIAIPLAAKTRSSVIARMTELAAQTGLLWDPDKMATALENREQLHPTALDNGVALLHPRRPLSGILAEPFLALGRTYQGIPFGASRGALTDIFFLICSTTDQWHLRTLARLSRLVGDNDVLEALRHAEDEATARSVIVDAESRLF